MRATPKILKKTLEDALLHDAQMDLGLYKFELEALLPEMTAAVTKEKGVYVYAVTVNTHKIRGSVAAMILVDQSGQVFSNEAARDKLKALWEGSYIGNIRKMLPVYVKELNKGNIPINGVKTVLRA